MTKYATFSLLIEVLGVISVFAMLFSILGLAFASIAYSISQKKEQDTGTFFVKVKETFMAMLIISLFTGSIPFFFTLVNM